MYISSKTPALFEAVITVVNLADTEVMAVSVESSLAF